MSIDNSTHNRRERIMRRISLFVLVAVGALVMVAIARSDAPKEQPDPEKGVEVKVADLEDFVAKSKLISVNNLTLKEIPSDDENLKGFATLELKANLKNR